MVLYYFTRIFVPLVLFVTSMDSFVMLVVVSRAWRRHSSELHGTLGRRLVRVLMHQLILNLTGAPVSIGAVGASAPMLFEVVGAM